MVFFLANRICSIAVFYAERHQNSWIEEASIERGVFVKGHRYTPQ